MNSGKSCRPETAVVAVEGFERAARRVAAALSEPKGSLRRNNRAFGSHP
jgi:hypothetical protein